MIQEIDQAEKCHDDHQDYQMMRVPSFDLYALQQLSRTKRRYQQQRRERSACKRIPDMIDPVNKRHLNEEVDGKRPESDSQAGYAAQRGGIELRLSHQLGKASAGPAEQQQNERR